MKGWHELMRPADLLHTLIWHPMPWPDRVWALGGGPEDNGARKIFPGVAAA